MTGTGPVSGRGFIPPISFLAGEPLDNINPTRTPVEDQVDQYVSLITLGPTTRALPTFNITPFQEALGGTFEQQANGSYIRRVGERRDVGVYWPRQGSGLFYTGGNTFRPDGTAGPAGSNTAQVYAISTEGRLTTSTPTPFDNFLTGMGLIPGPRGGYINPAAGNTGTWYLEPAQVGGNHVISFSGGKINGEIVNPGTYSLTLGEGNRPQRLAGAAGNTPPTAAALLLAYTPGGMRPVMNGDNLTWTQASNFTAGTLTYQPAADGHGPRIALTGAGIPPGIFYNADSPDPSNRVGLWVRLSAQERTYPPAPAPLPESPTLQERITHYEQTANSQGYCRARRTNSGHWVISYQNEGNTVHRRYNFTTRAWQACGPDGNGTL